jgi:2-aminobenzoate-CoA ligase
MTSSRPHSSTPSDADSGNDPGDIGDGIDLEPSGHVDTFCRDALPPRELWPRLLLTELPELAYPRRLNAAEALLDARVAQGDGERTALVSPTARWSYRELLATVDRIARVLVEDLGLVPGNRVLLRSPNTPLLAACWLAVVKAGGVVVCTMPLLRTRELAYILAKARIRLALTDARLARECEEAMRQATSGAAGSEGRVVRFQGESAGEDGSLAASLEIPPGASLDASLETLMRDKPAGFAACDTAADDVAAILFTSGTTGQAKGTLHFHRDLLAITDCFARHLLRPRPEDLFCGSPSLAFAYGIGGLLLFPLRFGAAALLLEQPTPAQLLEAIQRHRATICFTVPTAYRALCVLAGSFDLRSLRLAISAGEVLPVATYEAWLRETGLPILDGIGATEMLNHFISNAPGDQRPGSTGRPIPGYRARIVDEEGAEVPPGVVGRLAVQGPTGCRYLDDPERQRTYVQDGWNLTGDAYAQDEDGYFWYQARSDDMIVSAGHNIAPQEVEGVLLEHPLVKECAVVGVADEERGQAVKAFVVLNPEAEPEGETVRELQEWVRAQIAPFKYPRRVEFVASLPRTETGKLQRFRLRGEEQ